MASYHRKKVIAMRAPEKANGAAREPLRELGRQLGEDVAAYFFNGRKQASAAAQINEALEENLKPLRKSMDEFKGRLDQLQENVDSLKNDAESSKGRFWQFWRKLLQPDNDTDRARERTRAHIAYFLIIALVVAIAATFLYVVMLSEDQLSPQEVINVTHGLGTTLLAPLIGLIGAVIGFYYGGQRLEEHSKATEAATKTAQQATQTAKDTITEAAQAATQTAKAATETAQQATQTARQAKEAVEHGNG